MLAQTETIANWFFLQEENRTIGHIHDLTLMAQIQHHMAYDTTLFAEHPIHWQNGPILVGLYERAMAMFGEHDTFRKIQKHPYKVLVQHNQSLCFRVPQNPITHPLHLKTLHATQRAWPNAKDLRATLNAQHTAWSDIPYNHTIPTHRLHIQNTQTRTTSLSLAQGL